jgi:hypothetical protein
VQRDEKGKRRTRVRVAPRDPAFASAAIILGSHSRRRFPAAAAYSARVAVRREPSLDTQVAISRPPI